MFLVFKIRQKLNQRINLKIIKTKTFCHLLLNRTWSSGRSVSDGWPDTTPDSENKDWPSAQQSPAAAFTDLVPEFEPGKPWKVFACISIFFYNSFLRFCACQKQKINSPTRSTRALRLKPLKMIQVLRLEVLHAVHYR